MALKNKCISVLVLISCLFQISIQSDFNQIKGHRETHKIRHQRHQIYALKGIVNELRIKQEISDIYLNNLQNTVRDLQDKVLKLESNSKEVEGKNKNVLNDNLEKSLSETSGESPLVILKEEETVFKDIVGDISHLGDNLKEAIKQETSKDEILILRQEMEYLRYKYIKDIQLKFVIRYQLTFY